MTMSAISHYRGGTIDVVAPVAKKLKAAYLKHGIVYRLSRFETGPIVAIGSSSCNTTTLLMRHCRQPSLRMPSPNRPSLRLQGSRTELAGN
jgi:hypothetical protein